MFSIIKDKDLRSLIAQRISKDNDLFFVDTVTVMSKCGYDVIKRKQLYGLSQNGVVLLQPIFDQVDVLNDGIVIINIKELVAIYSIKRNMVLSEFEYKSGRIENNFLILTDKRDRKIIYDMARTRFLHRQGSYDEYNLKDPSTEYVWAKRNSFYDYIHRETGRVITLPAILMAYDTPRGIWGLDKYQRVCAYNESGLEDLPETRRVIKENGGYLALSNYTYNIEHIIDVYGNILNI